MAEHDSVNLREYVDSLFADQRRATSVALIQVEERFREARRDTDTKYDTVGHQLQELSKLKASELVQIERVDSLRREAYALRESAERAISKTESAVEKRFESVNEFRAQLSDQAGRFMPREVADSQLDEIKKQLSALTQRVDITQGKTQGTNLTIGYMVTAATLVISIVVLLANNAF